MTRRTRFLTALAGGIPDRVPLFDFLFQEPLYERLIGKRPGSYNGPDAVRLALALDHDGVWLPFGGFQGYMPVYLDERTYRDEWGVTFVKNESSWPIDAPVEYPIRDRSDLARYRPPDPTLPGRTSEIDAVRGLKIDDLALTGGVQGPLTTAWLLMGYETICYALYDDPGLLADVFRMSNEFFMEAARRLVDAGCSAIWVSEDLGSSSGGFFSPDHYRRHVFPPFAELVDHIDRLGVPVILHSCGCITSYLVDLVTTPIRAIHPLQRTAGMDIAEVKTRYGGRLCIIGNIDSSRVLPYGTPEEVAAQVREAIDIAAPGGGYILASDHSLHDGIPVENILAMFRTGAEYGREAYRNE